MGLDAALLACDGEENLRDAVADVVPHNILDEEHRQPNADNGIDEVEPVGSRHDELLRQEVFNLSDYPLQEQSCTSCEDTNQQADEQDETALGEVSAAPTYKPCYEVTIIQN